jgi:hypothetical protein
MAGRRQGRAARKTAQPPSQAPPAKPARPARPKGGAPKGGARRGRPQDRATADRAARQSRRAARPSDPARPIDRRDGGGRGRLRPRPPRTWRQDRRRRLSPHAHPAVHANADAGPASWGRTAAPDGRPPKGVGLSWAFGGATVRPALVPPAEGHYSAVTATGSLGPGRLLLSFARRPRPSDQPDHRSAAGRSSGRSRPDRRP